MALKSSASADLQAHQMSPLQMYNPIWYHPLVSQSPSQALRSMLDGPGVLLIQLFAVDIAPLQET